MAIHLGTRLRYSSALVAAGLCAGCASGPMLVSRPYSALADIASPKPLNNGLPYYLPKAVFTITLSSTGGGVTKAPTGGATALMVSPVTTPAGKGGTPEANTQASAGAPLMTVALEHPGADPAAGATSDTAPYTMTATISKPDYRADDTQEYFLQYTRDNWADDTLGISVDDNGLLSTATGESVDQTGAVVVTAIQTAAKIAEAFTLASPPRAGGQPPARCALPAVNRSIEFEPKILEASKSVSFVSQAVSKLPTIWIFGTGTDSKIQSVSVNVSATAHQAFADLPPEAIADAARGVLFRDRVAWTVKVKVSPNTAASVRCRITETTGTTTVLLPNNGRYFWEDTSRAALVDRKVALTVKNGILTGVNSTRPSVILAAAKLPLAIIGSIVSLPFSGGSPVASMATPSAAAPAAMTIGSH